MKLLTLNQPRFIIHSTSLLFCCLRLSSGLEIAHVKRRATSNNSNSLPRLYIGPQPTNEEFCGIDALLTDARVRSVARIISGSVVELSKDQSHYLNVVLRRKNKTVRLFDGTGEEWLAEVSQEGKNVALAHPYEKIRAKEAASSTGIWLCFPPIKKRDRMRWLIEKTTELGCTGYIFLDTDHSEPTNAQIPKLHSYAVEASEQCERTALPRFVSVDCPIKVTALLQESAKPGNLEYAVLVCRERSDVLPLLKAFGIAETRQQKQLFVLIGPEGGWSPQEEQAVDQLQTRCPETVMNVSLGPRILRSETASISAVAAYQMYSDAAGEC